MVTDCTQPTRCGIEDCDRELHARGCCKYHYNLLPDIHAKRKAGSREYARRVRAEHPDRIKLAKRRHRENNPEHIKLKDREQNQRKYARHSVRLRAEMAAYYKAHPEKKIAKARRDYLKHRARYLERQKLLLQKFPERRAEYAHRRRARIRGNGFINCAKAIAVIRAAKSCHWCGLAPRGIMTVDHVIPVSKGGTHTPDNLVPACRKCNFAKHNRMPDEWLKLMETT